MLEEEMKPAIRSKRRGSLTNVVVLQNENTQLHMVGVTVETIRKLKFELLSHPAYSSDLSPSEYHNFGPL
jgi:hypothetical protein